MVNYDYITQELCENKNKPEMACNGKCHLMKELAKSSTDEQPTSNSEKKSNAYSEILFLETITAIDFKLFERSNSLAKDTYHCLYFRLHSTAIPHPPSC